MIPYPRNVGQWLDEGVRRFDRAARSALVRFRRSACWDASAERYNLVRMVDGGSFLSSGPVTGYRCDICGWEGDVSMGATRIWPHEQTHVDEWLREQRYVLPYAMDDEERMVLVDAIMTWW